MDPACYVGAPPLIEVASIIMLEAHWDFRPNHYHLPRRYRSIEGSPSGRSAFVMRAGGPRQTKQTCTALERLDTKALDVKDITNGTIDEVRRSLKRRQTTISPSRMRKPWENDISV